MRRAYSWCVDADETGVICFIVGFFRFLFFLVRKSWGIYSSFKYVVERGRECGAYHARGHRDLRDLCARDRMFFRCTGIMGGGGSSPFLYYYSSTTQQYYQQ